LICLNNRFFVAPANSAYKRLITDKELFDPHDFIADHLKPLDQASILYLDETPVFDENGKDVAGNDLRDI